MLYVYTHGVEYVVARTGQASSPVGIGVGATVDEAIRDISDTPIQSSGREPEDEAVDWARGEGWITGPAPEFSHAHDNA